MKQLFIAIKLTSKICKNPCAVRLFALRALFLLQPNSVCDHGDELAVRGLALGVGHGIAEVALQRLQIAAVPGYLDIFRACALKMGGVAFSTVRVVYCLVHWFEYALFIALFQYDSRRKSKLQALHPNEHGFIF